jgi:hypothetical protein
MPWPQQTGLLLALSEGRASQALRWGLRGLWASLAAALEEAPNDPGGEELRGLLAELDSRLKGAGVIPGFEYWCQPLMPRAAPRNDENGHCFCAAVQVWAAIFRAVQFSGGRSRKTELTPIFHPYSQPRSSIPVCHCFLRSGPVVCRSGSTPWRVGTCGNRKSSRNGKRKSVRTFGARADSKRNAAICCWSCASVSRSRCLRMWFRRSSK